jgi:hypothetical protein
MQTVVLKRFDHYFSAHILSTKLRDAGVESYLFDENSVTIGPFLSNALGGIKLVVDEADEVIARNLLSEFEEEFRRSATCPKCHGNEIDLVPRQETGNMITAIFTWLFSNYALSSENIYECRNCGYQSETLPENVESYN